jgi:hypothetical protein
MAASDRIGRKANLLVLVGGGVARKVIRPSHSYSRFGEISATAFKAPCIAVMQEILINPYNP